MDPAAKSSCVPFSQAKEDESGLWQKSNCVVGLHPAATAEHVLQRADARSAAVNAMAAKGAGTRGTGALGPAVVFQPCPGRPIRPRQRDNGTFVKLQTSAFFIDK